MIEEPYRWLEAIQNRREYVRDQIKGGSPVFAASLNDGILLLGIGSGQSKVFELFDRHAMAGLGHPADIEKIRQGAIDAAHLEAFTRAPEDVTLRRLVSFGLSPQLKNNFEQIFAAPFLIELLLAELASEPAKDLLLRLHFDGSFSTQFGGVSVVASSAEPEKSASDWLTQQIKPGTDRAEAARFFLQAWWTLTNEKSFGENAPEAERNDGWRGAVQGRVVEIGWLNRGGTRAARYEALTLDQLKL
jgi:proteasome alpha subunit